MSWLPPAAKRAWMIQCAISVRGVILSLSTALFCISASLALLDDQERFQPQAELGSSLERTLGSWSKGSPIKFTLDPELRDQKVTFAPQGPVGRRDLLDNVADLLQSQWRPDRDSPDKRVLKRSKAATDELARRRRVLEQRLPLARAQQRQRLIAAFRAARSKVDGPTVEIFPGHWGRIGVPPGSEPLVRFLDILSDRDWDSLCEPLTPSGCIEDDSLLNAAQPPTLLWRGSALSRDQRGHLETYLSATGGGDFDPSRAVFTVSGRFSQGGTRISVRIFGDSLREGVAVIAGPGSELKKLDSMQEEPLFIGIGPVFSEGIPAALEKRAPDSVVLDWKRMDYAEAALALARVVGVPVLSDYYTLDIREMDKLPAGKMSIAALFDKFSNAFGCQFAWSRGMLLIRRGDWYHLDSREMPEKLTEYCLGKKRPGGGWRTMSTLTLVQLASVLRREQLQCLRFLSDRENRNVACPGESRAISKEYELLRLIGELTPQQRREFVGGQGLTASSISSRGQRELMTYIRINAPSLLSCPDPAQLWLRLAVTRSGKTVLGLPDIVKPLELEAAFRTAGKPVRFSILKGIPYIQ